MIDRISRAFVHYPASRQHPFTPLATNVAYAQRENIPISGIPLNRGLEPSYVYTRKALESFLIRTVENEKRYDGQGMYNSTGHIPVPPHAVEGNIYLYRGQYIDVKG